MLKMCHLFLIWSFDPVDGLVDIFLGIKMGPPKPAFSIIINPIFLRIKFFLPPSFYGFKFWPTCEKALLPLPKRKLKSFHEPCLSFSTDLLASLL